ncbi:unannotated protein [freshwater metagenome]|uniref:Unannotated protein n=1 Tax=freshwater metagenome TaxID=449393 RepID=A0A6J6Z5A0_9ZZZZ
MGQNQGERVAIMAKQRPSLADITQESLPQPPEAQGRGLVVPLVHPTPDAHMSRDESPRKEKPRRDRPHTTLYLDHPVRIAIKRIALEYDKKPHDLLLEGVEMMLLHYTGKTIKDITT